MPSVKIHFTDPDEFIEELTKDREAVDRKIVRITLEHKMATNDVLFNVSLLATARFHGDIVRLERFCGQYMKSEGDNQTLARTHELVEKLSGQCQDPGLEVRAGVIELS